MMRFVFPTVTRRYCKKNPTAINKEQVELVTLPLLTSFFIWLSGILAVIVKRNVIGS